MAGDPWPPWREPAGNYTYTGPHLCQPSDASGHDFAQLKQHGPFIMDGDRKVYCRRCAVVRKLEMP